MKYAFAAAALLSVAVATPAWSPPAYESGETTTVEVTKEVTITSCAATVTDCPAASGYPVPSESAPASYSAVPSAPAGYSSGVESSPVEPSAPAGYSEAPSAPAASSAYPSSPVVTSEPAAPYPSGGPSGAWGTGTPVASGYATGTGAAYPSGSGWVPVPATGAGSSIQTGGILAAAGALFALFL